MGARRSGGAMGFQGDGESVTIDDNFLVVLQHEEEEGKIRL
jgi:hypothetical protein